MSGRRHAGGQGRRLMIRKLELERELEALDRRKRQLDDLLRDAAMRQRYSRDDAEIERARRDEETHLRELDRLMTRCRAVEGKLLLMRKASRNLLHS